MSTDSSLPEPGDTGITGKSPDASAEPEPFLAEAVDDDEHIVAAELVEPVDPARLRLRFRRPPAPPGPPHPGFWWAVGWCLLMLFVAQLVVPVGVLLVMFVVQIARLGGLGPAMDWLTANQYAQEVLLPAQMAGHIAIFLMALVALRLVVGKSWPRPDCPPPADRQPCLPGAGRRARLLVTQRRAVADRRQGDAALRRLAQLRGRHRTAHAGVRRVLVGRTPQHRAGLGPLAGGRTAADSVHRGAHVRAPAGRAGGGTVSTRQPARLPNSVPGQGGSAGKGLEGLLSIPWWGAMLVIAVTPAFSEEFWCRAFLGRGLVGHQGYVLGVIWTSVLLWRDPPLPTPGRDGGRAGAGPFFWLPGVCAPC